MFSAVENLPSPVRRKLGDLSLKSPVDRAESNQEVDFDEPARRNLLRAEALDAVVAEHLEQLIFLIEIHRHPQTDMARIPPYNATP